VQARGPVLAPIGGRLDLLLEWRAGPVLIVESKIGAPVDERQIRSYLAYAEYRERPPERPWWVALVTRGLCPVAIRDPRFTGAIRWFQVADALAAIHAPRYPYLLERVLEFMREMPPWSP